KIKGLTGKRLEKFLGSWQQMRESRETMLFLYGHGITGSVALRLWRQYTQQTISIITENPYILCEEVWGIGFVKADEIARKIGISETSESRLKAGLCYTIFKASSSDGHTYLPREILLKKAAEELRLTLEDPGDADNLIYALGNLVNERKLDDCGGKIAVPQLARAEAFIAEFIQKHVAIEDPDNGKELALLTQALEDFENSQGIAYDSTQKSGICKAFQSRIFIITGGPGTGKTTMLKGIIALADSKKESVILAAPTGRAARRMQEVTSHTASAIHRLLEVNPETKRFTRNEDFPLDADLVIIDEFSMVDSWLCAGLMRALPKTARLILIGDKDQLPSVGPGNVLRDLLATPQIPSIRLSRIFRQASGNDIAEKATLINQGHKPSPIEGSNFHYLTFESETEALDILSDLISHKVAEFIGKEAVRDLQVLSPMHKGPFGTIALNEFLQNLLNKAPKGFSFNGIDWKVGDRVMQLKNNYEKNVFNGDIGYITKLEKEDQRIFVNFDGREVSFEGLELEEMNLAYACTIHKSQGSEYPAVILVLDNSHYRMLQRNLIYTGITRAKGHVWILSRPGALDEAIRNNRTVHRYTKLAEAFMEKPPSPDRNQSLENPYGDFMNMINSL
ncbi:MAG: ATP-dependent RecD-like DNA helicase, partial [Fibrobacteraceae bacterium]|nr:ATP-dependent RecD-like DNA helicase [Fibrobacteraceae bacterium]